MNEITITAANHNRKPLKGWSKIMGLTADQRDTVLCRATTRELNGHLLVADKDIASVKNALKI
jgi:hypothetical protein